MEGNFGKLIDKKALYVTPGNPVFRLLGSWLPYIPLGERDSVPFLSQDNKEKNFRYLTGAFFRGMALRMTPKEVKPCS
ncbi:hypothetical protein ES702_07341 [subsurface metagenome]